ncbi:glycosyltransferase family 4 protein [Cyanobium sp. ATX-6F1]|uniref:glycosyltransferase family 4 protein n=1 Tax=Cyanobium sp. ATX-6F1 TaxID=3137388 RepID=UPI0039BDEF67
MLLPHFAAQGVEAEVLAVDPVCVASPMDPWQADALPATVPIHRVRGRSLRWSRVPGLGSVEARCLGALAAAGDRLLNERPFDRVLVSSTAFGCFRLGPRWRQRFGVPFVLDYQDPWVNDYYRDHPQISPPGGRLKYALADRLNRSREPRVLQTCSGLIAVSAAYLDDLHRRYPFTVGRPSLELPFPGAPEDFERLEAIPPAPCPLIPATG